MASPRINSSMLSQYVGRQVKLVGKVIKAAEAQNDVALIQCSDNGQVEAKLLAPGAKMVDYVEIVCNVDTPNCVSILSIYNLGSDIALDKIDKAIMYTHDPRFKHLFEA